MQSQPSTLSTSKEWFQAFIIRMISAGLLLVFPGTVETERITLNVRQSQATKASGIGSMKTAPWTIVAVIACMLCTPSPAGEKSPRLESCVESLGNPSCDRHTRGIH